jgi:hypothetical protein
MRALILSVLCVLAGTSTACGLQASSGHIGEECDDARECDDDTLGCVPVDFDTPALGKACMPPPVDFICEGKLYGDGACDCGCAVIDIDCASELDDACAENGNQCPEDQNPVPTDNALCE